jgi:aminomethyltransferase
MTAETTALLRSLPLLELHRTQGAKIAAFAGWEVPIYFTSILEEHDAVRNRAGLFNISHMGYFIFKGKGARNFLNSLLTASLASLKPCTAVYSLVTNEQGGVLDDVILYERHNESYILIVNAGTREKDWHWILSRKPADVEMEDKTFEKVLFALQGPNSEALMEKYFKVKIAELKRFQFMSLTYMGKDTFFFRTGYTGEDGFEIMAPLQDGEEIWKGLLYAGKEEGLLPVGFGARDTLRLEARYPLYGHEMDETTNPFEAGLGWAVDLDKDFVGRQALREAKKKGVTRQLVGFEVLGRGIPREGYEMYLKGKLAGKVTSGCLSPTLKKNIGLARVESAAPVTEGLEIQVRSERFPCKVIKEPFYIGESLKKFSKKS